MKTNQSAMVNYTLWCGSTAEDQKAPRFRMKSGWRYLSIVLSAGAIIAATTILIGCKTGPIPKEQRMDGNQLYNKHCQGRLCEEGR